LRECSIEVVDDSDVEHPILDDSAEAAEAKKSDDKKKKDKSVIKDVKN
jgi:hypothetical protein